MASFFLGAMLPAIDLDNEFRLKANKIDDVGADRKLPPETQRSDLLAPQFTPQHALGIRWFRAQSFDVLSHDPLPLPLPQGEG